MFRRTWIWLAVVAALAGAVRFYRLGDGVLRGDELNRYQWGLAPITVVDYWKNWEPTNQIPLQEVFCVGIARTMGEVNEYTLRFPGAVLGWLTVLLLSFWVGRRWGGAAGFLAGIWMAVNPYHLHESRESYFYGFLIFNSAAFSVFSLEAMAWLRANRRAMGFWAFAGWTATALLTCMSHMSAWVYAVAWAGALFGVGHFSLPPGERKKQVLGLAASGVFILFMMRRWIRDAIGELRKVAEDTGYEYIGDRFSAVAPRVLPMFLAGFNWAGFLALGVALAAAAVLWAKRRTLERDVPYALLSWMTLASVAAMYLYIGGVGGGVAKETFFSPFWPLMVPWATASIWKAARALAPARWPAGRLEGLFAAAAAAVFAVLALPAWMVANLDGKPIPYRQIREQLDATLPEGAVVVVDRWIDPWVEMAIYPPSNAVVSFTIPDEPLKTYVEQDWRGTTRRAFERGDAQAFLRLTRNHEQQLGPWSWPERFFARKLEIANERALWLRRTGYSVMMDLHAPNTNRVVAHLFYNTDEDWAARARAAGQSAFLLYGGGWNHVKPWQPLPGWPEQMQQLLWVQAGIFEDGGRTIESPDDVYRLPQEEAMRHLNRGRWAEYRAVGENSRLRLFNLTDRELDVELKLTAIALNGSVRARVGRASIPFPNAVLSTKRVPATLAPGENEISISVPPGQLLLVRRAEL